MTDWRAWRDKTDRTKERIDTAEKRLAQVKTPWWQARHWSDYPLMPVKGLLEAADQFGTASASLLTYLARKRPPKETWTTLEKFLPIAAFYPGGSEYEAYKKWEGTAAEPSLPVGIPSWRQIGGSLPESVRGKLRGITGGEWERPPKYEQARLGMSELAESVPWVLTGGAGKVTSVGVSTGGKMLTQKAFKESARAIKGIVPKTTPIAPVVEQPPVVQKFVSALAQMKRTRKVFKPLRKEELGRKLSASEEAMMKGEGLQSLYAAKAKLRGELPGKFGVFGETFTPADGDDLINLVKASELQFTDKLHAMEALDDLFTAGAFKLPEPKKLRLLSKVFGEPFVKGITDVQRSAAKEAFKLAMDTLNLPRAILASWDMSAPLRQGFMMYARHPVKGTQALGPMFKAPWRTKWSEEAFNLAEQRVTRASTKYGVITQSGDIIGPELTSLGKVLTSREEPYMSRFGKWIPGVRQSERAFTAFLNDLRSRVWEGYLPTFSKAGATERDYLELARLINAATGRGTLPSFARGMSPLLNATLFSPRYLVSRVEVPGMLFSKSALVRKEAAKTLASFLVAGTALVTSFALAFGGTVEDDPRSADYGKVKIGKTRLDFWAGYTQWARFLTQLVTAERKLTTTGEITELNRRDVLIRFMQSKMSPLAGFIYDLLYGQTYTGEKMELTSETVKREAFNRMMPLFIQDLYDALEEDGLIGAGAVVPAFFGAGSVTYKTKEPLGKGRINWRGARGGKAPKLKIDWRSRR